MKQARKQHILTRLRDDIIDGKYALGGTLPTRDELQACFAASRQTVQNAMQALIDDGFVEARRGDGSYVSERPPHLYHYGLVSAERFSDSMYLTALQRAAAIWSEQSPFNFSVYCYDRGHIQSEGYQRLLADVEARRVGGLIFATPPYRLQGTPILEQRGMPRITLGYVSDYSSIPVICADYERFMDDAIRHLQANNRQRIALIATHLQAEGLAAAISLMAERCDTRPEWVQSCASWQPWSAQQAARLLMQLPEDERPDGLIISDDHLVDYTCRGLAASGVRIPQELSVVAHCNFPNLPQACVPVTRLGFDCHELLHRCLDHLAAQRRGETVPAKTCLPPVFDQPVEIEALLQAHPLETYLVPNPKPQRRVELERK